LRAKLAAEAAVLAAETKRLINSRDVVALREHTQRLHRHQEAVHAFINQLERFHLEVGPLGQ
jgi:hypothetical protein